VRKRRGLYVAFIAVLVLFGGVAFMGTARGASDPADPPTPIEGTFSDLVQVKEDREAGTLDIVIGPVEVPASNEGYRTPIQVASLPGSGWVHGFSWFVSDASGNRLSDDLLHHVNLIDPDRRELFSPTARRVFAAGRETGPQTLPRFIGYPLSEGTRFIVVAMFSNPEPTPKEVFLTVRLQTSPLKKALNPLPMFPFHMDVMGPVGEKSFPLPPGKAVQSWEGSPAVDGRILGLGGHAHDYATLLKLEDVTTGKVLYSVKPEGSNGRVTGVPVAMPWKRGGIKIYKDHVYRVTVEYDNTTDQPTPHGGMGVVGGVVVSSQTWPVLDRNHPDYVTDLQNVVSAPFREGGHGHGGHASGSDAAPAPHQHH